jgi:hypothetical protein
MTASFHIFQLTDSMEKIPSGGAASRWATQKIHILCNTKVHHRVHKSPPLIPVLSQIDPVHTAPSCFSKIHFNIILLYIPGSSQWFLSFWISHQNAIGIILPIRATCSTHLTLLDLKQLLIEALRYKPEGRGFDSR